MKVLVLNGPNLGRLGSREPDVYGTTSYRDLVSLCEGVGAELGLEVAAKPDSQDICFVPDSDYAGLVKRLRPETEAPGDIVDVDGRVLEEILAK